MPSGVYKRKLSPKYRGYKRICQVRHPGGTEALCEVPCDDCGAPMQRRASAIRNSQRNGTKLRCSGCRDDVGEFLEPYRERLITTYAKVPGDASALRGFLRMATLDDPIRMTSAEFWETMRCRYLEKYPNRIDTARNYLARIRTAVGISRTCK